MSAIPTGTLTPEQSRVTSLWNCNPAEPRVALLLLQIDLLWTFCSWTHTVCGHLRLLLLHSIICSLVHVLVFLLLDGIPLCE